MGATPVAKAFARERCHGADGGRLRLAGAICQGLSPDPELFLNRMELLAAYSMIEHLFLTADGDGHAVYTPMGQRHVRLLRDYEGLIGRVSKALHEDCARFRPAAGAYSPYGVLYGFSSNLVEHIAFATLRPEGETRFSLEDVFLDGQDGTDKLAWVTGWRKLPHLAPDAAKLFDYPQEFAEAIFDRLDRALRRRASDEDADIPVRTGRIFVVAGECVQDSEAEPIPDLPARYILASDRLLAAAHKADFCDEPRLASDRREGRCVLSYETPGGRAAITKDFLTEMLGAGRDVKIAGLPPAAARALTLMCPNLVFAPEDLPS